MGKQKQKLHARYDRVYLLIEGIIRVNEAGALEEMRNGKWQRVGSGYKQSAPMLSSMLTGAIASAGEFAGMRVIQCGTPRDTARVCVALLRWWQKEYEDHSAHDPVVIESINDPCGFVSLNNLLVRMLAQVKGIGSKRAREIAETFGTIENIVMQSCEELQNECGKKTGEAIWKALRAR